MSITDKLVTEWAFRCKKGYPDMNNPDDMKVLKEIYSEYGIVMEEEKEEEPKKEQLSNEELVAQIADILQAEKGNTKLLTRVLRTLENSSHVDDLKKFLVSRNIDKTTFDNRNLPAELIDILAKANLVDKFVAGIKDNKLQSSGNAYDTLGPELKPILSAFGRLTGAKGSVGIGRGEILFPMIYSDVSKSETAGDLLYQGKDLEVKALGISTKNPDQLAGGPRISLTRSAPLSSYYKTQSGKTQIADIFKEDYDIAQDKKAALDKINNFIVNAYYKGDNTGAEQLTKPDMASTQSIAKVLYKAQISGYTEAKNITKFLLFNPATGDYKVSTVDELIKSIGTDVVFKPAVRSDINPQLVKFN
jgi:hypothetical protein